MAHQVSYTYNKKQKRIPFSYQKYHHIYEAIAIEEGIDLTKYRQMEQQVESVSKGTKAVREFRKSYFLKLGVTDVWFHKDGLDK